MHYCVPYEVQVLSDKTNDLSISDVYASSKSGKSGDIVWISFKTHNLGNATSSEFANSIRWSADGIFTEIDPELRSLPCGELSALETISVGPVAATIPINLKPGTYYIGVCADLNSDAHIQVVDSDRKNNCSYLPFTLKGGNSSTDNGNVTW
jgi:hypothetical protein